MENLRDIELEALIDTLSKLTDKYSRMLSEGGDELEFEKCKRSIEEIQSEINDRKQGLEETPANPADSAGLTA